MYGFIKLVYGFQDILNLKILLKVHELHDSFIYVKAFACLEQQQPGANS